MKNKLVILVIMLALLVLSSTGCKDSNDQPGAEISTHRGLVYMIEDNSVLVVEGIESVNIPWNSWFEKGARAIMFSVTADTVIELNGEVVDAALLERGQAVEVRYSGALAESYPEQGGADKIIIIQETSAGDFRTDSGRFSGLSAEGEEPLISIRISGVPEELPPRAFRLTNEASVLMEQLNLQEGSEILFRYLDDDKSDGLIFDISLLGS